MIVSRGTFACSAAAVHAVGQRPSPAYRPIVAGSLDPYRPCHDMPRCRRPGDVGLHRPPFGRGLDAPSPVAGDDGVLRGRSDDQPVFRGARTAARLRDHVFRNGWFDPASTATHLDGLTPPELRHTAASLAVSAGANIKAVQRMLGHASAAMTLDTYADLRRRPDGGCGRARSPGDADEYCHSVATRPLTRRVARPAETGKPPV